MANREISEELIRMGSQAQLTSLHAAVESAFESGVPYKQAIVVDGWELVFGAPKQVGQLPVLYHAFPLH